LREYWQETTAADKMRRIERRDITVPNVLTVLRILMALVAAFLLNHGNGLSGAAAVLLLLAMLLDYFDGWYARKFQQTTSLGAHLDPFADKVMITVIFIALAIVFKSSWFTFLVCVILAREFVITVYRWRIHERSGTLVPASPLGKVKTLVQCIVGGSLISYIYIYPGTVPEDHRMILAMMLVTTFITVDSGMRYVLPRCSDGKKRSVIERLIQHVFGEGAREV
jgi:CDP-diacylglycerol--glycerol-3-phosphate 3-phosphatidyltransferase